MAGVLGDLAKATVAMRDAKGAASGAAVANTMKESETGKPVSKVIKNASESMSKGTSTGYNPIERQILKQEGFTQKGIWFQNQETGSSKGVTKDVIQKVLENSPFTVIIKKIDDLKTTFLSFVNEYREDKKKSELQKRESDLEKKSGEDIVPGEKAIKIAGAASPLSNLLAILLPPVMKVLKSIWDLGTKSWEYIKNLPGKIANFITNSVNQLWKSIQGWGKTLLSNIPGASWFGFGSDKPKKENAVPTASDKAVMSDLKSEAEQTKSPVAPATPKPAVTPVAPATPKPAVTPVAPATPKPAVTPKSGQKTSGDEDIKAMIKRHEGGRATAYKDSLGLWTIGYGHLIGDGKSEGEYKGRTLSQKEMDDLFEEDYANHKLAAQKISGFNTAPKAIKGALVDMTFNMGPKWIAKWPKTAKYIASGLWSSAADALQDSKWYKQVKSRAVEIVDIFRSNGDKKSQLAADTEVKPNMYGEKSDVVGKTVESTTASQLKSSAPPKIPTAGAAPSVKTASASRAPKGISPGSRQVASNVGAARNQNQNQFHIPDPTAPHKPEDHYAAYFNANNPPAYAALG